MGRRIRQDILKEKRAEYGEKIVAALGRQLEVEFGRRFSEKNLRRMVQFAEVFPDEKIVAALRRQLGWTHFRTLIPIDDPLKRDFYAGEKLEKLGSGLALYQARACCKDQPWLNSRPDPILAPF